MKYFQGNHLVGRQLCSVNATIASGTYGVSDVKVLSCLDDVLISNRTMIVPYGKEICDAPILGSQLLLLFFNTPEIRYKTTFLLEGHMKTW